ncbi:MAG: DUF4129 domain-containing protein [Actinomycetales bacterium]|nr:DUF4129 domain-containing protein [Actinomycetales bacterium]
MRTRPCDSHVRAGRRTKAEQFADAFNTVWEYADEPGDVADVCVTLAVHAGIAASDVLTCARLGVHARGDNHGEAVALLRQVDPALATHLAALLEMKSKAGYGHAPATATDLKRAKRAMDALVIGQRLV